MVTSLTILATMLLLLAGNTHAAGKQRMNGFDLENASIPIESILSGGPPRDGIPAIDTPTFIPAGEADFLADDDRVMGVVHDGVVRAYPIRILNRHEIVNDDYRGRSVVVTFCPLCGSGIVFDGHIDGNNTGFGVSGLLHNSDVLLYDRRTDSLWSQIMMRAISGPMEGRKLQPITSQTTSWQDWLRRHPDTQVLSTNTGYRFIDYDKDPYADYKKSNRVWFPLTNKDRRLSSKTWVLGVSIADTDKAYPLKAIFKQESPLRDTVNGTPIRIEFDADHQTAMAFHDDGTPLQSIQLYWFAWAAFHPETELYSGKTQRK